MVGVSISCFFSVTFEASCPAASVISKNDHLLLLNCIIDLMLLRGTGESREAGVRV